jgi:hypothetical protein
MSPARGDRKRCTYSSCHGTMQFSKYASRPNSGVRPGSVGPTRPGVGEEAGWVCDLDTRHFQALASREGDAVSPMNVPRRALVQ